MRMPITPLDQKKKKAARTKETGKKNDKIFIQILSFSYAESAERQQGYDQESREEQYPQQDESRYPPMPPKKEEGDYGYGKKEEKDYGGKEQKVDGYANEGDQSYDQKSSKGNNEGFLSFTENSFFLFL